MTRTQKSRVLAFFGGATAIVLAIFMGARSGEPFALRRGGGAPGTPAASSGNPGRDGEFRRRNPFQFVRAHPPPAPPPAAPAAPVRPPPPKVAPPQEPLPIRLVGTMAGNPLGMAFTTAVQTQREHLFQIGDNLGDELGEKWRGVVLTEVRRKQATFRRGEQEWTVEMGEQPKGVAAVPVPPPPASPLGFRGPQPVAAPAAPGGERVVARAEVEKNLKNLGYLITQLNVQPFFQSGQPAGFRVSRIRPGSFIDKMGARNGDIIQGVNGKPIKTIKDAFLLYNSFKTQQKVDITVLRGGKAQTMGFALK